MEPAHALPNPVPSTPRTNGASSRTLNGATNGSSPALNGASPRRVATTPAANCPSLPAENRDLAGMLRRSLDDARGNPQIRERLEQLAKDSARVEHIVQTLGARHAVVRELSRLRERLGSDAAA